MVFYTIKNAKLINTNYEKLYWSIDESYATILTNNGCNVKTVNSDKFGTTYNISTKIASDGICYSYKSLNKSNLEVLCTYTLLLNITPYTYNGKSGKSITAYVKSKTGDRMNTINQDIVNALEDIDE